MEVEDNENWSFFPLLEGENNEEEDDEDEGMDRNSCQLPLSFQNV